MFYDRKEAGKKLAQAIKAQISNLDSQNSILLALPRGGVVVGAEIARILRIPLEIIVVRKIGYPGNPEYAIGAVGESGNLVMGEELERSGEVTEDYLRSQIEIERKEIKRRLKEYRGKGKVLLLKNKIVILIDDGAATGLSMKAAIKEVKEKNPTKIIVALPVAPPETISELKKEADEVICLKMPTPFYAVGNFYANFPQISDLEVKKALR